MNDEFTVSGFYLNDEHTDIIVHDNTSIIIIESNLSFDDPYVIRQFNEQLSELDLSWKEGPYEKMLAAIKV